MPANLTRQPARPAIAGDTELLVKSRDRVKAYGEVFTPQHMVNQMLDLVAPEHETGPGFVDKTFFEPAAGDGNFLLAILRRKLAAIERTLPSEEWLTESLFALASIYGIELLEDNHKAAQAAMLDLFTDFHHGHKIACGQQTNLWQAASFLISTNIQRGDTLNGLDPRGNEILFSWWNRVPGTPNAVQRDPFTFNSLRQQDAGMFSFDIHETYPPCPIDLVHQEGSADV